MHNAEYPRPRFARPPVIETVLGVQFEPLSGFGIADIGLFWEKIRADFPHVEERPRLEPAVETFGKPGPALPVKWRISDRPEVPRAWYVGESSDTGQQLIQLQNDRFIHNWRRKSLDEQEYPSYDQNRIAFEQYLARFISFAEARDLGEVQANQCEVTYVNHIPVDPACEVGEMITRCFPSLRPRSTTDFLQTAPERMQYVATYAIQRDRGRLTIQVQPAIVASSGQEIIDLRLTARGAPESHDLPGLLTWLDLGHSWVVNGFVSFTSSDMHERWERLSHG